MQQIDSRPKRSSACMILYCYEPEREHLARSALVDWGHLVWLSSARSNFSSCERGRKSRHGITRRAAQGRASPSFRFAGVSVLERSDEVAPEVGREPFPFGIGSSQVQLLDDQRQLVSGDIGLRLKTSAHTRMRWNLGVRHLGNSLIETLLVQFDHVLDLTGDDKHEQG